MSSPEIQGNVIDAGSKASISGAKIFSRRSSFDEFALKTVSSQGGEFRLSKESIIIPIPHSYLNPSVEVKVVATGYASSEIVIEENPKEAGRILRPRLELEPLSR